MTDNPYLDPPTGHPPSESHSDPRADQAETVQEDSFHPHTVEEDAGGEVEAPSKKRVLLLAILVLAVGAAIAFFAFSSRPQPERQVAETPPPLVQVMAVSAGPVDLDVHSQGTVEPRTESTLVSEVAGRITAVSDAFAAGGFFRQGQVLVEIDPRDYRLAVSDAEAALAQARVGLERESAEADLARQEWDELGRGGEASPLLLRKPQLAQARAAVAAAEAAVERARLNLSRTRVTAPFAGRVRSKRADVGQFVTAGTPVAEVYSTDFAEVRLPVSRQDLAFLDVGVGWAADGATPRVELTGELGGEAHTWVARVVRTAAEIDPQSRMLSLFARVDDPLSRNGGTAGGPPPLPMGLFVEAEIEGRSLPSAYVLPRRALRPTARTADTEVMVVDPQGQLTFRPVRVVRTAGDEVVVGSGLRDGDRVVVSPLEEAVDGMTVRTTLAEGGDPTPREATVTPTTGDTTRPTGEGDL